MIHVGMLGISEAAVTVLMIVIISLCVCGAVFIYRAVKGQRGKPGGEDDANEPGTEVARRGGDDGEDWSKSTGNDCGSEDWDVDSYETIILSTANNAQTPLELLEENLRKNTQENVKEPAAEVLTGSSVGATSGSSEDHVKCKFDVCGTVESVDMNSDLLDYQDNVRKASQGNPENSVEESTHDEAIEPHVDVDEPSETESAQEMLEVRNLPIQKCQSVEDLSDSTLLSQEIVNKHNAEEIVAVNSVLNISSDPESLNDLHQNTKMEDPEVASKVYEGGIPLMTDLDFYGCDEQTVLLSDLTSVKVKPETDVQSNQDPGGLQTTLGNTDNSLTTQELLCSRFDHILTSPPQNYLGFTVPSLQGDLLTPLQFAEESKDKTAVKPAGMSHKKNEISIMEAIMDSNEWLSSGPPDTRDLPWLTPTQSKNGCGFTADVSSSPVKAITSYVLPVDEVSHQDKVYVPEVTSTDMARDDGNLFNKKVGTVLPMPQLVQVSFRVHYITHSPNQILAVTGNQQELGSWETFVPLRSVEDGFWFCTISLPLDSQVEWKFILVEEGKVRRWEECENRFFAVTGQEEWIHLNKNWGYV